MNRSGHIIILQPDVDLKNYETADFMQKNLHHLKTLRDILNFIDPLKYRGTGRQHFDTAPFFVNKGQLEVWQNSNLSEYKSIEARKKLALLEEANTPQDTLDDLCFYSLDEMKEVYELIEDKENYEIIHFIERFAETSNKTLGFDVGYLAADYSVIADTTVKPTWHPPNFDDMQDILEHLKQLNEHCLFPTLEQAEAYRGIYLTKDWGEKELYDRQITTIQVRSV
jgi:hypothetical protein